MSRPADCPACSSGNHDSHDTKHGSQPGLIGGTICECKGDCPERASARATVLSQFLERNRTSPPALQPSLHTRLEALASEWERTACGKDAKYDAHMRHACELRDVLSGLARRAVTEDESSNPPD